MTAFPRFVAPAELSFCAGIGELAALCLELEVATYPKPGLVSHIDSGAHHDMDFGLLLRSAKTLTPFFAELAHAGAGGAVSTVCGRSASRPNAPCWRRPAG